MNQQSTSTGPLATGVANIITREFLRTVPEAPGVYIMADKAGRIVYIGKAKSLRKRLASYGRLGCNAGKIAVMIARVSRIETMLTRTEKEALLLESTLIKKHKPKYNVILRDDKNYPLIKVTVDEEWPRLIMVRRRSRDGARYFGPFASASAMWNTINLLNNLYPLRRCKTKKLIPRNRPCLNYQMGHCPGACAGKADHRRYLEMVEGILMVLAGKKRQLVHDLKKRMKEAATAFKFEEAAQFRDKIAALQQTLEKQVTAAAHSRNQDVFGFSRQGEAVAIAIVFVRDGMVTGQQSFYLEGPIGSDREILAAVVSRYYGNGNLVPAEILLPFVTGEEELLADWLSEIGDNKPAMKIPRSGHQLDLLQMAQVNAAQLHVEREKKASNWEALASSTAEFLHLGRLPHVIECLDISNISGQQAVGSLVCFEGGEPAKKNYRRYKIQYTSGPDDYAMMREVLGRRLGPCREDAGTGTTPPLPDLLILDGGKGQLNIGQAVLRELNLEGSLELLAIAKERKEEGEKLFRPGRKNPILLAGRSPVMLLIARIRDEAHRFAIAYHRKLRRKEAFISPLDKVAGIGSARKKDLLLALGSLDAIKQASQKELEAVPRIGPALARQIWKHFHSEKEA